MDWLENGPLKIKHKVADREKINHNLTKRFPVFFGAIRPVNVGNRDEPKAHSVIRNVSQLNTNNAPRFALVSAT